MMVESAQIISNGGHHPSTEKKEKNLSKARRKRSKSAGKHRSSKKDPNFETNDMEWNADADKGSSNSEMKIQVEMKESASAWDSQEINVLADSVDAWDEKDESNRDEEISSPTITKVPSRRSSRKSKKSSRKQAEKNLPSDKLAAENGDHADDSIEKSDEVEHKQKEKGKTNRRSSKSRAKKEDTRPSVPRRVSDGRESDDNGAEKSPSILKNARQFDECGDDFVDEDADDKQPVKQGRRTTRRVSPESATVEDDDNELSVGSFHSLRVDSDKPRSRSNTSRSRRTPSSGRRNKGSAGGRSNRRRLKDKSLNSPDHVPANKNIEIADDGDSGGTHEINLRDGEVSAGGSTRTRRERRRDRERLGSNDGTRETRKIKSNASNGSRFGRSSLSSRRGGIHRSHSERWNRAVESLEGEGGENPHVIRRRAHESLNRASDGLSRSAHTRIRRNNSSGLGRMTGSLSNRSQHGTESSRTSSDGRRTPKSRRSTRRHQVVDSAGSIGDDSLDSFGDGRSQATLESIDDFEDFGEDFYGMELQTPGMVDFEEEMLDLMQRANPEVTDHLDRRVHRKREMVVYDHNMPLMTRQALLTRQASSQVQRQFFDGSNIDKKRLLLRNDSMTSNNSSHRAMRTTRRAPPRAKSSGLGAMGRGGYMDSIGGPARQSDSDDRRRVFRSRSSHGTQAASFNQYYQNKPNKVRSLSRAKSGDLIQPHPVRGQPRSSDQRRRSVRRANSTTSLRRSNPTDHVAPRKPERKNSGDENRRFMDGRQSSDDDGSFGEELEAGHRSPSYSLRGSSTLRGSPTELSMLDGKKSEKTANKNDMSIKRNRSKLHSLMYMTKMSVDMDVLFQKVREGEQPRSPINALRMPSP